MADVLTEVLGGEGEVYAADRLLRRTTYRLTLSGAGGARIEGAIDIASAGEALILSRAGRLTLLLDDGRHLSFALAGPGGQIRALGPLEGIKASSR